jgi:four helix bundle protein
MLCVKGGAMAIKGYRDLVIWQKATDLAKEVYRLTWGFPSHEKYGLASQLQRAAVSVASNIAEGQARHHSGEFRQFLFQALGSLAEVDTQLYLASELGYVGGDKNSRAEALIEELRRMMYTLVARLPSRRSDRRPLATGH